MAAVPRADVDDLLLVALNERVLQELPVLGPVLVVLHEAVAHERAELDREALLRRQQRRVVLEGERITWDILCLPI